MSEYQLIKTMAIKKYPFRNISKQAKPKECFF